MRSSLWKALRGKIWQPRFSMSIYPISPNKAGKDIKGHEIFSELHSFESLQAQLGYPNSKSSTEDDPFHFFINGYENQVAYIDLEPGQEVISETQKHVYATAGIEISSSVVGGVSGAFTRMFSGSTMFMVNYKYVPEVAKGRVAFAHNLPSKILAVRLHEMGGSLLCKTGSFIVGDKDIEISVARSKNFSTGFFGSQGFLLQKITGGRLALLGGGGSLIRIDLRYDEVIKVSPSCVLAFSETIDYEIEYVGGSNIFGLGGLFFTNFKGPGRLYLQTMNFDQLMSQIKSRIPTRSSSSSSSGGSSD